jgi:hypothetical protein
MIIRKNLTLDPTGKTFHNYPIWNSWSICKQIWLECALGGSLQHQKKMVVAAMLNFWIKWKTCTCNVENHPIVLNVFGRRWMLSDGNI